MKWVNHCIGASITATSQLGGYPATNLIAENFFDGYNTAVTWYSALNQVTNQDMDIDFGSAKTFRKIEIIKHDYASGNECPKDIEVYVSDDGVAWGVAVHSATLTKPSDMESEIITLGSAQTKRYMRFRCKNNHGSASYMSFNELLVYDDITDLSSDGITNITSTSVSAGKPASNLELSTLTGAAIYWQCLAGQFELVAIDFDFGSEKYIDGLVLFLFRAGGYEGENYQIFLSDTGAADDWGAPIESGTLVENATLIGKYQSLDFGNTYHTRYIRLLFLDSYQGSGSGFIYHLIRAYEADDPGNPSAPDKPTAYGFNDDDIAVVWTYAEPGNFASYTIDRNIDGGGWVQQATGIIEKFYVDTDLGAVSNVQYRVYASDTVPKTSSASTASDAIDPGAPAVAAIIIGATPSPIALTPSCWEGDDADPGTIYVGNLGAGTLNWSVTDDAAWLSVAPASGTATGEWEDALTVTYSTAGLAPGIHTATITITDAAANNTPQTIDVTLTVTAEPATPDAPSRPNARGMGAGFIGIYWDYTEPGDFSHYEVWRSMGGGPYTKITISDECTDKNWVDLTPGGTGSSTFTYQVKAVSTFPKTSAFSLPSTPAITKGCAATPAAPDPPEGITLGCNFRLKPPRIQFTLKG